MRAFSTGGTAIATCPGLARRNEGKAKLMELNRDELMLLDWLFCGHGDPVTTEQRDGLMRWAHLRRRVWVTVIELDLATKELATASAADLDLSRDEQEELLALVPTTFRWGPGEDCGLSLKRKLAYELYGADTIEEYAERQKLRALFGGTDASSNSGDQPESDTDDSKDLAAD